VREVCGQREGAWHPLVASAFQGTPAEDLAEVAARYNGFSCSSTRMRCTVSRSPGQRLPLESDDETVTVNELEFGPSNASTRSNSRPRAETEASSRSWPSLS